jgi:hypothetical protein
MILMAYSNLTSHPETIAGKIEKPPNSFKATKTLKIYDS